MSKCLITKLQAVVENQELSRFGEMKIRIKKNESPDTWIVVNSLETQFLKLIGGYWKQNNSDELTIPANSNSGYLITMTSDECIIIIDNKYYVQSIVVSDSGYMEPVHSSEMCYMPIDASLMLQSTRWGYKIMIDTIESAEKVKDYILSNNIYIPDDIEYSIDILKPIYRLIMFPCNSYNKLSGNICNLGNNVNMSYLTLYNTLISGKYDEFVNIQRMNGRTTGTITINATLGTCTVEFGNSSGSLGTIGDGCLSWDESRIILYNNDSIENATIIKCIGYSDSVMNTWRESGKTVIKCD